MTTRGGRLSDEELALEFLEGRLTAEWDDDISDISELRNVSRAYLAGMDEEEARRALVQLLESDEPLPRRLRYALASLFDSNPASFEERLLVFQSRSHVRGEKGYGRFLLREMAGFVAEQVAAGSKLEAAMFLAKEKFDVSLSTVERAWRKNKSDDLVRYHLQRCNRQIEP
jgi:hypothetical protein